MEKTNAYFMKTVRMYFANVLLRDMFFGNSQEFGDYILAEGIEKQKRLADLYNNLINDMMSSANALRLFGKEADVPLDYNVIVKENGFSVEYLPIGDDNKKFMVYIALPKPMLKNECWGVVAYYDLTNNKQRYFTVDFDGYEDPETKLKPYYLLCEWTKEVIKNDYTRFDDIGYCLYEIIKITDGTSIIENKENDNQNGQKNEVSKTSQVNEVSPKIDADTEEKTLKYYRSEPRTDKHLDDYKCKYFINKERGLKIAFLASQLEGYQLKHIKVKEQDDVGEGIQEKIYTKEDLLSFQELISNCEHKNLNLVHILGKYQGIEVSIICFFNPKKVRFACPAGCREQILPLIHKLEKKIEEYFE